MNVKLYNSTNLLKMAHKMHETDSKSVFTSSEVQVEQSKWKHQFETCPQNKSVQFHLHKGYNYFEHDNVLMFHHRSQQNDSHYGSMVIQRRNRTLKKSNCQNLVFVYSTYNTLWLSIYGSITSHSHRTVHTVAHL